MLSPGGRASLLNEEEVRMPNGGDKSAIYQIKVRGRLGENWSAWFDGMVIAVEEKENDSHATITTLTGPVTDQAALHGILSRIRDLGLPLLLVQYLEESARS
jgi:hypothetical protein